MRKIISLLAIGAAMLYSGSANAALYNIEFNGYPDPGTIARPSQQYSGKGAVLGATGDYWNIETGISSGPTALLDSKKNSSGISFAYSGTAAGNIGPTSPSNGFNGTPYAKLMSDYISVQPGHTGLLIFNGLKSGVTYTLYVYSQGVVGSNNGLIVNGVSAITNNAGASSFDATNLYVTSFTASGTSKTITFDDPGTNSRSRGLINGLQLSTPVPEPSSVALVGIGGLLLVAFQLKRSGALSGFNV